MRSLTLTCPTRLWTATVTMLAAAALAAPTSAPADAEHGSPGHDMGAADHGMTPDEHAAHGGQPAAQPPAGDHGDHGATPSASAHDPEHAASPGHDAGHGAEAVAGERPVKLLLAGFAAVNALVLLAAALLRRRSAAVKRRETLARVRRAAGARETDPIVET